MRLLSWRRMHNRVTGDNLNQAAENNPLRMSYFTAGIRLQPFISNGAHWPVVPAVAGRLIRPGGAVRGARDEATLPVGTAARAPTPRCRARRSPSTRSVVSHRSGTGSSPG